ncbi:UNVERIFIED_CONTAM: hypothetical protein Slati_0397700 [Sesamum latifolium]|uniref:Uncharacterized protein n=1 Tax=Sesamum latifolium TaxID=2727402 RepID=A0AAW2XUP3_9LAMI
MIMLMTQSPLARSKIQSLYAGDYRDSSNLRTTLILSESGIQLIPIKPPRLSCDDPPELVQSVDYLVNQPTKLYRCPTSVADETRQSSNECNTQCKTQEDSRCPVSRSSTWNALDQPSEVGFVAAIQCATHLHELSKWSVGICTIKAALNIIAKHNRHL